MAQNGHSKSILDRLEAGEVIIGDGSYVFTLEKRGYVKAGDWTPEAAVEEPEGVRTLAREFAKAGADVTQTFTFYSTDDWSDSFLQTGVKKATCREINEAACDIARGVADEYGTMVAGAVVQTEIFTNERNKAKVQAELSKALQVLIDKDVDFLIAEYFFYIQEMEWAIELCRQQGKPLAATMAIGPRGDQDGVSAAECAVRMARAGADIVGVNCLFDLTTCQATITEMKKALDAAGLHPHLMVQPNAYRCPDCGPMGWLNLPEFPFAIEPRLVTRFEVRNWARQVYDLGVRYIGGCCGFEPYLVRAIAEELAKERGRLPEASRKSDPNFELWSAIAKKQKRHGQKGTREYWNELIPSTGRPMSASLARQPDPQIVHQAVFS